jgi:hypothetical protein
VSSIRLHLGIPDDDRVTVRVGEAVEAAVYRRKPGKMRAVRSDRGELFGNASEAARAVGAEGRGGHINRAIAFGWRFMGRKWSYAYDVAPSSVKVERLMRAVVSDRGERFRSVCAAARAFGNSSGGPLSIAIRRGHRFHGRMWSYETEAA